MFRSLSILSILSLAACEDEMKPPRELLAESDAVTHTPRLDVGIVSGACSVTFTFDDDPGEERKLRDEFVHIDVQRDTGGDVAISVIDDTLLWVSVQCLPLNESPPEVWLDGGDPIQYCDWAHPENNKNVDCSHNFVWYYAYPWK